MSAQVLTYLFVGLSFALYISVSRSGVVRHQPANFMLLVAMYIH